MAGESFQLERLRQNWARAAEPQAGELPARLAAVRTPRNPYPEARAPLERKRPAKGIVTIRRRRLPLPIVKEAAMATRTEWTGWMERCKRKALQDA